MDKGSLIEAAVVMRLNRNNLVELHPFFLLDIDSSQPSASDMTDIDLPLGFESVGDYDPPVQARIFVYRKKKLNILTNIFFRLEYHTLDVRSPFQIAEIYISSRYARNSFIAEGSFITIEIELS